MPSSIETLETLVVNLFTPIDGINQARTSEEMHSAILQTVAGLAAMALNPQTALLAVGTNGEAALVTALKIKADIENGKNPNLADLASIAGNAVVIAGSLALMISPQAKVVQVAQNISRGIGWLGFALAISNKGLAEEINPATAAFFNSAQTYVRPPPPRRVDPLALDLNGNGIETVGINSAAPILFDNNGDGVKTASGWVSANDGLLVWDRNGNGTIDNGRELFGDATLKSDGTLAADGFNALADLDLNHDGVVNALDADFANLRVWRDLNQNGVSDAGEVFTLDSFQIAGINLANTVVNTALGNGNTLNETGSYVRSDGTTGLAGNLNLANNAFFSQFTDALPPTAEIQALPDIQGAGMVRGLRDAAGRSPQLAATLGLYAAATCDVQKTMLDNIIGQWSATSTFFTTAARAATLVNGVSHTSITLEGIVTGTPAYAAFMDKLSLVEKFNGQTFQPLPVDQSTTLSYTILREQQAFIDQSYGALKGSVYDSLLVKQAANDAVLGVRRVG